MLGRVRVAIAGVMFILCTLLFLDITGAAAKWFGWIADIQFLPALLAMHVVTVVIIIAVTLLFGRIYCSVICPMGIFQDAVSWLSARRKKFKMRFRWSPEVKWLRYGILILFVAAFVAGVNTVVALLAPYSAYGRIVHNIFSPIWLCGNNLLAWISGNLGSYAFAHQEVWVQSLPTFIIAAVTFVVITVLAWRGGRTYCNTVCPVGSFLSLFSRFSLFRPVIDTTKCKTCHLCERKCKASCIDLNLHKVDYSRCVDCFECVDACKFGAMRYQPALRKPEARKDR